MLAIPVSRSEILVMGGSCLEKGELKSVQLITVESRDCLMKRLNYGGKTFFPPVYD